MAKPKDGPQVSQASKENASASKEKMKDASKEKAKDASKEKVKIASKEQLKTPSKKKSKTGLLSRAGLLHRITSIRRIFRPLKS